MTDNQKNIIGTILLNMSASTVPVTEEMISNLVDMNDNMNTMMYGTPKLTPNEREEVINALHAALFVRIDRGHFVKENDLTALFCNLLDNAVESASKQDNSFIELSVIYKPQPNLTVITMKNSCRKNPFNNLDRKLISTKSNSAGHGFGIKSMKRIVKKYNGDMEIYYDEEEKVFHTIITLKVP